MVSIGLLVVSLLSPGIVRAETTIFVANATSAVDLTAILREELPASAFVASSTAADLSVSLSSSLRLEIIDRSGITVLERAIEGERDAAVRVAALLIVEARASWVPPPPPPPLSPPPTAPPAIAEVPARSWRVGLEARGGIGMGWAGASPPPAVGGAVYFELSDFSLAAGASYQGCCTVNTGSVQVDPAAWSVMGEGRWTFWRPFGIEASALIAVGYQRETVTAQVVGSFASPGPLETRVFGDAIGRGGLGIGIGLFEWLRIRVDGGAQVQQPRSVTLPPEYTAEPARRRAVVPFGLLAIGVEI